MAAIFGLTKIQTYQENAEIAIFFARVVKYDAIKQFDCLWWRFVSFLPKYDENTHFY